MGKISFPVDMQPVRKWKWGNLKTNYHVSCLKGTVELLAEKWGSGNINTCQTFQS